MFTFIYNLFIPSASSSIAPPITSNNSHDCKGDKFKTSILCSQIANEQIKNVQEVQNVMKSQDLSLQKRMDLMIEKDPSVKFMGKQNIREFQDLSLQERMDLLIEKDPSLKFIGKMVLEAFSEIPKDSNQFNPILKIHGLFLHRNDKKLTEKEIDKMMFIPLNKICENPEIAVLCEKIVKVLTLPYLLEKFFSNPIKNIFSIDKSISISISALKEGVHEYVIVNHLKQMGDNLLDLKLKEEWKSERWWLAIYYKQLFLFDAEEKITHGMRHILKNFSELYDLLNADEVSLLDLQLWGYSSISNEHINNPSVFSKEFQKKVENDFIKTLDELNIDEASIEHLQLSKCSFIPNEYIDNSSVFPKQFEKEIRNNFIKIIDEVGKTIQKMPAMEHARKFLNWNNSF